MAARTAAHATDLGFIRDRHYNSAQVGNNRLARSFETAAVRLPQDEG